MHVVAISNDLVRLSFIAALLADAGIETIELDGYTSAIAGGIGAIPRRLAVLPRDRWRAEHVLTQAGESMHGRPAGAAGIGKQTGGCEDDAEDR